MTDFRGRTCKRCGKKYRICGNCGWWLEDDIWIKTKGYCTWTCGREADSTLYGQYQEALKYQEMLDDTCNMAENLAKALNDELQIHFEIEYDETGRS